jgi:hypothetical protein
VAREGGAQGFLLDVVDVGEYWRRFNRRALLTGVGLILLSAALWLGLYWGMRVNALWMLADFGDGIAVPLSHGMPLVVLSGLVFECAFYGKRVYDRNAHANSVILEGVTDPRQEFVVRRTLAAFDWEDSALEEVLLMAPRCTARAFEVLTSMVFFSEALRAHAQRVVDNLSAGVEWRGVEEFKPDGPVVVRLLKMGLVQLRVKEGLGELRLTPRVLRPVRDIAGA